MKFRRSQAFTSWINGHLVVLVRDEFPASWLLIVDEKVIGFKKTADLAEAIAKEIKTTVTAVSVNG